MFAAEQPPPDAAQLPRRFYRVAEFAAMTGIGRRKTYLLVESGEIPAVRVGGRTVLIPVADAEALLERWAAEARARVAS